jgi:hypothetical protein
MTTYKHFRLGLLIVFFEFYHFPIAFEVVGHAFQHVEFFHCGFEFCEFVVEFV